MGIIEDSIFSVYKDALTRGDMDQAEHAVDLVKRLREKVDIHGFLDPQHEVIVKTTIPGTFFEPFPYRYYEEESIVIIENTALLLTRAENKLFKLFSENETSGLDIKPITHQKIRTHLWENKSVTSNAIRLAVKRLRNKIDPDINSPRLILNLYQKGYVFFGKKIDN